MSNPNLSEIAVVISVLTFLAYIISHIVMWGKFKEKMDRVVEVTKELNDIVHPKPGSQTRLVTVADCGKEKSECWKKLGDTFEDITRQMDRDGKVIDRIQEKLVNGSLRTTELERLEKKTHE